jgi:hypothetical protein
LICPKVTKKTRLRKIIGVHSHETEKLKVCKFGIPTSDFVGDW